MSRHAAPLSDYSDEERVARLHEAMLAEARAHLTELSATWGEPDDDRPYELALGTGTLPAIIARTSRAAG